jgi:hypothetical protein
MLRGYWAPMSLRVRAMERAIARTGRILVDAIPVVYDTPRQVRILKEDGSFDMTMLNQQVQDQQTGQMVTVNDVSKGKYDVSCRAGPSFQNRQDETVAAITEMAQWDPAVIQESGDILYGNVTSPGMDLVAERKRSQIFKAGGIPEEQMTDDEKQQQQAMAQQPPPEDPLMVAARAETAKAEADMGLTQIKGVGMQREQDRKDAELQMKEQKQHFDLMKGMQSDMIDQVKKQTESLENIAEAMGIPAATKTSLLALEKQGQAVIAAQSEIQ